jgi:hypothetical protein
MTALTKMPIPKTGQKLRTGLKREDQTTIIAVPSKLPPATLANDCRIPDRLPDFRSVTP